MNIEKRRPPVPTTQKQLRAIARESLAKFLRSERLDTNVANTAVAVLHAPQFKGE